MNSDVKQTRSHYNLLIGQIIENVLGIDDVRKLFEAAEKGDAEAQEKIDKVGAKGKAPSGFLAVDLGFVNVKTKEALLTAQAAERTLLVMDELDVFYQQDVPVLKAMVVVNQTDAKPPEIYQTYKKQIDDYYRQNIKHADVNNKMFQFIGTKGESDMLVLAQATQQLATEYHRNEQMGIKLGLLKNPMAVGNYQALGTHYIDGFRRSAADSYTAAATALAREAHMGAASNAFDVAESLRTYDYKNALRHTPKDFAETARWVQKRLTQKENNMYLSNPDVTDIRDLQIGLSTDWDNKMTTRARQAIGLAV